MHLGGEESGFLPWHARIISAQVDITFNEVSLENALEVIRETLELTVLRVLFAGLSLVFHEFQQVHRPKSLHSPDKICYLVLICRH